MDFDTKEGIAEAVQTLEGFGELRRTRHHAAYVDEHRLNEFVVLGRWLLDSCGNCMGAPTPFNVSPVLTKQEFFEEIGRDNMVGFGMPTSIPGHKDICPFCNRGWSIHNVHDCYQTHIGQAWFTYHARCYRIKLAKETQGDLEAAFDVAGLGPAFFIPVPNEYYPDPNAIFYTYWFDVYTSLARFKVGWRKRVIHLEVVDPTEGYDTEELFPKESTTKFGQVIHCWGYTKMAQYLAMFRSALIEKRLQRLYPRKEDS